MPHALNDGFMGSERSAKIALAGILLIAAGLSVPFFGESLRLDEAQSLWQSSRGPAEILSTIAQDVHVPLYHELLRVWRIAFGDGVEEARLFSRLFFLLSIPALYALGSLAYGRGTALFASFLFAISPFLNWYGSEIRMYTLFVFLSLLNQYFFLRLFREGGRGSAGWYALTALLGVFSHYFFFLILLIQGLFYLIERREFPAGSLASLAIAWTIVATAFLPWGWYVLSFGTAENQAPLLFEPTTVNLFSAFSQFFFGFQTDAINTFALSLWPILVIFAFLGLRKTGALRSETTYFMLSAFLPIFLVFFASLFLTPVFVSRYLIFTVPALYLLVARIIAWYPIYVGHFARVALVGLMLAALAIQTTSASTPVKEDYRGVAEYLEQNATPADVIVLSAPFTVYPIEYYYRGGAGIMTLPVWNQYETGPIPAFSEERLPEEIETVGAGRQRLWLVLSYDQGYEETVRTYLDQRYARIYAREFSPGLNLYGYRLRYDTPLMGVIDSPTVR